MLSPFFEFGAGNEIRTRDPNLGKVVLYQLSYSRIEEGDILGAVVILSTVKLVSTMTIWPFETGAWK